MPSLSPVSTRTLLLVLVTALPVFGWQDKPTVPQLQYLEGFQQRPYAVAVSPDGRTVVAGSVDGQIATWDRLSGEPIRLFQAAPGPILGLDIARSGNTFAAGDIGGSIQLFDLPRRHPLSELTGLTGDPTCIAVSPDGRVAVSGDSAKIVRVWDLVAKKSLRDLPGHTAAITAVAFVVRSRTVIASAADGTLRGWLFTNGEAQGVLQTTPITSLAVAPEERMLALAGEDGLVRLVTWPPRPRQQLVQHAGNIGGLAFTPDGRIAVSGGAGQQVHLFDGITGKSLKSLAGQASPVTAVDIDPLGKLVVTGGANGAYQAWQVSDAAPQPGRGGHTGPIHAVALDGKQSRLVTTGADGTVRIWNLTGPPRPLAGHTMSLTSVAVTTDGKTLVTGSSDKVVRTWNAADGQPRRATKPGTQPVSSVGISPDGLWLARGDTDGILRLEKAADGSESLELGAHNGAVTAIVVRPGGKGLVSAGADGTIKTWTPRPVPAIRFPAQPGPILKLAVSRDRRRLATGSSDGIVRLLSSGGGAEQRRLEGLGGTISAVTFNNNASQIAAGNNQGKVRLWNTANGALQGTLTAHTSAVTGVLLHPDGKQLLTSGADGTWKLWKLPLPEKDAKPATMVTAHAGGVTALALSPNHQQVLSGGADKLVKLTTLAGQAIRSFSGHAGSITAVKMNKDTIFATSTDKTVRSWSRANATAGPVTTLPDACQALALAPGGTRAAVACNDGTVRVLDTTIGRELEKFSGHQGPVHSLCWTNPTTILSGGSDKALRTVAVSVTGAWIGDATRVHDLVLLPDGQHVISGGEDKTVKQWTLAGKLVRTFATLATPVRHVAVSPDGKTAAAGGDPLATQKEVRAWSVADGKQLCAIQAPAGVTALGLAGNQRLVVASSNKSLDYFQLSDGRLLEHTTLPAVTADLVCSSDGQTVFLAATDNKLWALDTSLDLLLTGHTGAVTGATFLPDGRWLLTAGADKTIRQWNLLTGKSTRQYAGATAAITSLALSADGRRLVAATGTNQVLGWPVKADATTNTISTDLSIAHPVPVADVSLTGTGSTIATAGADNQLRLWHASSGKLLERLTGHSAPLTRVALTADGKRVLSGGNDRNVIRWTPSVTSAWLAHKSPIRSVAFTPEGKHLVSGGDDKRVARWMVPQGQPANEYTGATAVVRSLAISGDGRLLVSGGDDKVARVWTLDEGRPLAQVSLPAAIRGVVVDETASTLVAVGDQIVQQFQITSVAGKTQLVAHQQGHGHTKPVTAVALASPTRTLVSVGLDRTLRAWYSAAGPARTTLKGHEGPVYGVSISPDGKLLASGGGDRTVRLWNLDTSEAAGVFKGHTHQVTSVAFNPTHKQLASTSLDGTMRVWPLEGAEAQVFGQGIRGGLLGVAYLPNGNGLSIVGQDRQWRMLNRSDLKIARDLPGHNHTIYAVDFNATGSRAVTLDYSGKLFLWDMSNGNIRFHQQLPITRATSLAFVPDGSEVLVAGDTQRVLRVLVPTAAR